MKKIILVSIAIGIGIVLGTTTLAAETGNGITPESGPQKMSGWISDHIQYPADAQTNQEQGTVYVAFQISENGELISAEVLQGVSQTLDAAALEAVQKMPVNQLVSGSEKYDSAYIVPIKFVIK